MTDGTNNKPKADGHMTHGQRRSRRAKILEDARGGSTLKEMIERYGVTGQYVRMICQDSGVAIRDGGGDA